MIAKRNGWRIEEKKGDRQAKINSTRFKRRSKKIKKKKKICASLIGRWRVEGKQQLRKWWGESAEEEGVFVLVSLSL